MNLVQMLSAKSDEIIDEAAAGLARARLEHYQAAGQEASRQRLKKLYDLIGQCLEERAVVPMIRYAEGLAGERFSSGFDLREVQTAFNVLEESIWKRVLSDLPPEEFAQAIGMISTVLGVGKDSLARAYVSLATKTRAPSLDLKALFRGVGGE